MKPFDVTRSIYGLAKFRFAEDEGRSLGILSAQARRRIEDYSMAELSQIAASLVRTGVKNNPLTLAILRRVSAESLREMSIRSLVNLMHAFSRSGITGSAKTKKGAWPLMAEELFQRLKEGEVLIGRSDLLSALDSFAFANKGSKHQGLFDSASMRLTQNNDHLFTNDEVSRYLKACVRTRYRNLDALAFCARSLRFTPGLVDNLTDEELLKLRWLFDELGAEMKELDEEEKRRGIKNCDLKVKKTVKRVSWFH